MLRLNTVNPDYVVQFRITSFEHKTVDSPRRSDHLLFEQFRISWSFDVVHFRSGVRTVQVTSTTFSPNVIRGNERVHGEITRLMNQVFDQLGQRMLYAGWPAIRRSIVYDNAHRAPTPALGVPVPAISIAASPDSSSSSPPSQKTSTE